MNYLKGTFLLAICVAFGSMVNAQAYKLKGGSTTSMKLSGTSSLHKWSMKSQTFNGDAQFNFKSGAGNVLNDLTSLTFTLPVLTLKSGKKELDKNAYKALKTGQHKNIVYTLTSATVSSVTNNKYLVKTHGNLNIAGVTKDVAMNVYCMINKDESITCTGTNKMNMTDYDVKPPTFMGGAMKTGDAITLDFTMVYNK